MGFRNIQFSPMNSDNCVEGSGKRLGILQAYDCVVDALWNCMWGNSNYIYKCLLFILTKNILKFQLPTSPFLVYF